MKIASNKLEAAKIHKFAFAEELFAISNNKLEADKHISLQMPMKCLQSPAMNWS